jgi:hypothetical protein
MKAAAAAMKPLSRAGVKPARFTGFYPTRSSILSPGMNVHKYFYIDIYIYSAYPCFKSRTADSALR